ncbi:MAG: hypothetical protein K6F68_02165 [Clostridiales bacterium]|nr:hypothetical protein [Clostridiales bacterium]
MTLFDVCTAIAMVEDKLAYGEIDFYYDNLMSAMKPGHPADILDDILSQIGWDVQAGKPVELERVKGMIEDLKGFKETFRVRELQDAIRSAEQYVKEQDPNYEVNDSEETDNMDIEKVTSMLKEAFEADDIDRVEEIVNEYEDDLEDEDLVKIALEIAVECGNTDYVEEHIEDYDTWDMGYLMNLTDDPNMIETLNEHGVYHDWDYFADFRFAYETVEGSLLAFDSDFQKEAWEKYLAYKGLTEQIVISALSGDDIENGDIDSEDVEFACGLLGVALVDGALSINDPDIDNDPNVDGWSIVELLREIGYDVNFEGESWKLETSGVYYIE